MQVILIVFSMRNTLHLGSEHPVTTHGADGPKLHPKEVVRCYKTAGDAKVQFSDCFVCLFLSSLILSHRQTESLITEEKTQVNQMMAEKSLGIGMRRELCQLGTQ